MFITVNERIGTFYYEFQFCKNNKINFSKLHNVKHWEEDLLVISQEDYDKFYELYGNIFKQAILCNNEIGFDPYGINYYTKENIEKILDELQNISKKYRNLILFLEQAYQKYNGFYILGI